MPCRVGITSDPARRRSEWESSVVGFRNWRIIGTHQTREQAQQHEEQYARQHGCQASNGGHNTKGPWHEYHFDYVRNR